MYIHSDFTCNPTKNNDPIPYYPIRLRKKLEEGEVEPIEVSTQNMDYHTMMVSKELIQPSRFITGKDCTYLVFTNE